MAIKAKNWEKFQHYKTRNPPWIKLHRSLLDDYEFQCLPVASRALAPMLWLLASETEDGLIPLSDNALAYRLRIASTDLETALKPLIDVGLFELASIPLANGKQHACLETEGETEAENRINSPKRVRTKYTEPFLAFWIAYPTTPNMAKREAWDVWKRLPKEEQEAAASAVPKYVEWLNARPSHEVVHACRFLSKRRFEGFNEMPEQPRQIMEIG